ncbi:Eco57I restriction-modification methylase domain-containing protein [Streptococcus suis]
MAVIGNPPYQESDNSSGNGSAKPLYDKFIDLAISLSPRYITLITPSVWFLGGKGLDEFRNRLLEDRHFKVFNNYLTPNDVFSNVNLRGGVNFFLWDSSFDNKKADILVNTFKNGKLFDTGFRPYRLRELDIFISESSSFKLLDKLLKKQMIVGEYENSDRMLYKYISERNPFGIPTTYKLSVESSSANDLRVYASKGNVGYIDSSLISKNTSIIENYKVLTAFANNIGTDLSDDNLNTIIASPKEICTETYLVIGASLNLSLDSSKNLGKYLTTRFVRFLISVAKANQNGTRKTYRFVPLQDFTSNSDIDWSQSISEINAQLYRKYGLSDDEIEFIESKVKEMG